MTKVSIYGGGILNRIKLHEKDGIIKGHISVKTSPDNIVSFNVYQTELTSNNKVNPSYKAFKTVMNEYNDSTSGDPDTISIRLRETYPNACLNVRTYNGTDGIYTDVIKNIKFLTRDKNAKSEMIFKLFGCRVDDINKDRIGCKILDFRGQASPIQLVNKTNKEIPKGSILDFVGHIREGLEDGKPICEYHIKRFRDSEEQGLDFELGIEKYKQYVDSISTASPF